MSIRLRRFQSPAIFGAAGGGGSSYSGPGDVNALGNFWALRAYSNAYALRTAAAIDIVDSGGANAATINVLTTGALDSSTLSSWITAHGTASVAKIYDQVSTKHLTQGTVANMPTINMTGINSKPVMIFNGTSQCLSNSSGSTISDPFGALAVAKSTNNGAQQDVFADDGTLLQIGANSGGTHSNTMFAYGGASVSAAATDGVAHSLIINYDTTGSGLQLVQIDNVQTGGTIGSLGTGTGKWSIGQILGSNFWKGAIAEVGLGASGVNLGSYLAAYYADQHAYWNV